MYTLMGQIMQTVQTAQIEQAGHHKPVRDAYGKGELGQHRRPRRAGARLLYACNKREDYRIIAKRLSCNDLAITEDDEKEGYHPWG